MERLRYRTGMNSRRMLLIASIIALFPTVLLSLFRFAMVSGDSMMPALRPGQMVVALAHFKEVRRGDIVLVRRGPEVLIKRVAYLGGEKIAALDQPLFTGVADFFELQKGGSVMRVPRGRLVVLGDNRLHSDDSRRFGPVPRKDVIGRVIAVLGLP